MKLLTPSNLSILAATILTAPLSAQTGTTQPGQQQRPPLPAPRGGLRVEIATANVKVVAPPTTEQTQPSTTQRPPKGFPVSGLVANMSREDLAIAFTSAEAAERHLSFSLYDSAGNELWNSEAELADGDDVEAVLPKRKSWKRLVLVPLKINETPLEPGVYTVEVSVGADKVAGAAATFEVVEAGDQPPAPPAGSDENGGMQPPPPPAGDKDGQQQPPAPPAGDKDGQQQPPAPPTGGTGGQQQPPPPPTGDKDGQQQPPAPPTGGTGGQQQPPPPPTGGTGGQQQPPAPPTGGTGGQQQPPPPPTGDTGGQQQPPPPPTGGTGGQQLPPPPRPGSQPPPQR